MGGLWEIEFNYNIAIQQARELEDTAWQLENAANRDMENILNEVSRAWKSSESAPRYIQKGQKVAENMRITGGNLRTIAVAIRLIAERIRQAEIDAWEIANAREDNN